MAYCSSALPLSHPLGSLAQGFLRYALILRVAFVVEEYVWFDPMNADLLCAEGVASEAEFVSHLVNELLNSW